MLFGVFCLLACQLAGEGLVRAFALPLPGPVLGIVLLFGALSLAGRTSRREPAGADGPVGHAADALLRLLGLLFVPAGVGLAQSYDLVLAHGLAIVAALVGSTFVTLLVTVATFRMVVRLTAGRLP